MTIRQTRVGFLSGPWAGCIMVIAATAMPNSALAGNDDCSSAAVCRSHPDRVKRLFEALDLDRPGLEQVKAAVSRQDLPVACDALLAYYRDGKSMAWLRTAKAPEPTTQRDAAGDAILKDTFTFNSVTGLQARRKDGGLDWHYTGPKDEIEWGALINRHGWFGDLLAAWRRTGNAEYPACFDVHIRDWILANPKPEGKNHHSPWSEIQVGIRLMGWPSQFYGFQQAAAFTPAGRILMLSSIPEHAERCPSIGGNWGVIVMRGLAGAAVYWPEFKDAGKWFDRASAHLTRAIKRVAHPDGVQIEMSYDYHNVCVECFEPLIDLAGKAGRELPADYRALIDRMWDYSVYSLRPDGQCPPTGDSDIVDCTGRVLGAAAAGKRNDWLYVATGGQRGARPPGPPSRVWPDSGQMVMRSGWDRAAQWAYFDTGPLGGWHGHYDNLHLSVFAFGRSLLVDGGRYTYKDDAWRGYFRGSASHNVVLVDGQGQNDPGNGASLQGNHAIRERFDFARGHFAAGFGQIKDATHTRAVVYIRGICWVVFDRLAVEKPRTIEPLWHFHPDCTVRAEGSSVASTDKDKGNLRIVPAGGPPWQLRIVKGQEEPTIQGWNSQAYNTKQASATAVYQAKIDCPTTFAWVLLPALGMPGQLAAEMLPSPDGAARVKVTLPGGKIYEVAVRLADKGDIGLTGGRKLQGQCAIIDPDDKPLVGCGRVLDEKGNVLAVDE